MSVSVSEAERTRSCVPSVEPPSELRMTVRSREKSRANDTWTARTTSTIVAALFNVGRTTRTSTWPTAISCDSSASESELSCSTLQPAQPEPVEVVRAHHHHVRRLSDAGKDAVTEHLNRNGSCDSREVELDGLCSARQISDDENHLAAERA